MKAHASIVRVLVLGIVALGAHAARSADAAPPAPVPLGDGKIKITPPPSDGWDNAPQTNNRVVAYTTKSRDGIMAIELLPSDMVVDQNTADAILRQLRQSRLKSKAKIILQPTVEPDDRFALRIHERYNAVGKDGAPTDNVADQLHIYRYVGPSLLMLTVNTVASDPDVVKATQAIGEDALLSATGPGAKPVPIRKPATKPAAKPATKPVKP